MAKRSDFEHLVLAPGARPEDFLAYAAWEQSLEALRAKRARRLQCQHTSKPYASQARTVGIFERAVTRHPGSVALWRAYLGFVAGIRATRRWRRVMARALRMHPREPALWVLAGGRSAALGDMGAARGYFMRGCRFCAAGEGMRVWLEYARCEMDWLQKMEAKARKMEGGATAATAWDAVKASEAEQEGDVIALDDGESDEEDDDSNGLLLPDPEKSPHKTLDAQAVQQIRKSPAMEGAIPLAIFEVARKQSAFQASTAEAFFDVFAPFTSVSSQGKMLQTVLDTMQQRFAREPSTWSVLVRRTMVGVDLLTAAFPRALREALALVREGMEKTDDKVAFATKVVDWMNSILGVKGLDQDIKKVLELTKAGLEAAAASR